MFVSNFVHKRQTEITSALLKGGPFKIFTQEAGDTGMITAAGLVAHKTSGAAGYFLQCHLVLLEVGVPN